MMHSEDFKSQDCVSINTAEYIIELEVTNNKGKINHLNKKKSFNSSSSLNDITDLEERSQVILFVICKNFLFEILFFFV